VGIVAANLGNYLFHLISARFLGPADYADVATLVALASLISFPLIGVQFALARYVAHYSVTSERPVITALARRSMTLALKVAGVLTLALVGLSYTLQQALDIDSLAAVVMTNLLAAPALLGPVVWGLAQGLERFRLYSFAIGAAPVVRALLAALLLALGFGVAGAIGATLLAAVAAFAIPLWYLRGWFSGGDDAAVPVTRREAAAYLVPVIVGVLSITSLTTVDVIVAKAALPDEDAGLYGGASLIGRVILYLPAAIVTVLLPRVSARAAVGRETADVLARSLLVTGAFCLVATVAAVTLPRLIVLVAFGSEFEDAASLLWRFALVMSGFAILNVLLSYHLAHGAAHFSWLLLAGAVVQLGLFAAFHDSAEEILYADMAVAYGLIAVQELGRRIGFLRVAPAGS
jgi:O-antigen/teichoic acid export membrane protein